MFPFLTIFIIFLIALNYFRRKNMRLEEEQQTRFWERENQANATRKKDISNLDYITIPQELLTMPDVDDSEITSCYETLRHLSAEKILNLNHMTNTEVKLAYGAANLPVLTAYDDNYTTLICTLVKLGKKLAEYDLTQDAIAVLSFGLSCQSDISENYTLLVKLYQQTGDNGKLAELYSHIQLLPDEKREYILKKCNQV